MPQPLCDRCDGKHPSTECPHTSSGRRVESMPMPGACRWRSDQHSCRTSPAPHQMRRNTGDDCERSRKRRRGG
eukprot:5616369-Prymnesium_polylepis.1